MTRSLFLLAAAAVSLAGCKQPASVDAAAANAPVTAAPVAAPGGDWTKVVSKTADGGYRMGNPEAKVQLVEYAAFTCPHCREFEEAAMTPLMDNYVKKGFVALELRPFMLSPLDMPASIIARCGGEATSFGLTRALFAHQKDWIAKVQSLPPATLQALDNQPPEKKIAALADLTGLTEWAAKNGLPRAKAEQCLANQAEATELVRMNSDAVSKYNVNQTPSFLINGKLVEIKNGTPVWQQLEAAIKGNLS